ncbi:hypothetical protein AA313_de0203818 [Arthrobotrys entomopaga]|nr:hypothetical protein AA313_de0203818 [Arthrobotrys entomopaga]
MSAPSDSPKTPGFGGPPKSGGGFKNLLARFEQGGGSPGSASGSNSATPEFKPKPIGRVKTNFVAVTDASGVVGLVKADGETSPAKTPTKFAFGGEGSKRFEKFESPKTDKPPEKPSWVTNGKKIDVKKEEPPKSEEPVEVKKEEAAPESAPEVTKEPEPQVVDVALEKDTVPDVEDLAKEAPAEPAPEEPKEEPKEEVKEPTSGPEPIAVEEPVSVPDAIVLSDKDEVSEEPEPQVNEEPVPEPEETTVEPEPEPEKEETVEKPTEEPLITESAPEEHPEDATEEPTSEVAEQSLEAPADASINIVPPTPVASKAPSTLPKASPHSNVTKKPRNTPKPLTSTNKVPKATETKPIPRAPASKPVETKPKTPTTSSAPAKSRPSPSTSTTRTAPVKAQVTKSATPSAKPPVPKATAPKVEAPADDGESSAKSKRLSTGASKAVSKPPTVPISARSGAYGPTSSSSSKLSTPPAGPAKTTARAKTPSRLMASNRPNSRMTHAKSPSVSPTRAEHRIRNTQSRASMASESTVRPKSQTIDPNFLARLSRPTASSASKVVEKRLVSPPAPTLAKKVGSQKSRSSRKTDDDQRSTSTRASMEQDQRPVFEDNGPNDEHHETAPDLSEHQVVTES